MATETKDSIDRARIAGKAYGGGPIRVAGYRQPVVIDFLGLDVPASLPLLVDHENRAAARLGTVRARVEDGALVIDGEITATGDPARDIIAQARAGAEWHLSIGADPREVVEVRAGGSVRINGREHSGPLLHVKRAVLREVSVVAVGADAEAGMTIAATWRLGKEFMPTTENTTILEEALPAIEASADAPEAVKAERMRIAAIREVCGDDYPDIESQAIEAGWTADRAGREVLGRIRAARPEPDAGITGWQVNRQKLGLTGCSKKELAASFYLRAGRADLGEEAVGAEYIAAARQHGPLRAFNLAERALAADGLDVPRDPHETIRAALSTVSLPNIAGDVARRILLQSYTEAESSWRAFARVVGVPDFRQHAYLRLSALKALAPVSPGGEIKHGVLNEEPPISFSVDTFAQVLGLDRRMIENDDLGAFNYIVDGMGRTASRSLSDLVWRVVLENARSHFSEANDNLLDGADSCLTAESLARAIEMLETRQDADGNDLDFKATTLIVPPALKNTAREILNSEAVIAVGMEDSAKVRPSGNALKGALNLVVDARIQNEKKFPNASPKRWYLSAAPVHVPVIVGFLNGCETPTLETLGFNAYPDRLQFSWRVFHDFGAALGDPKAMIAAIGE